MFRRGSQGWRGSRGQDGLGRARWRGSRGLARYHVVGKSGYGKAVGDCWRKVRGLGVRGSQVEARHGTSALRHVAVWHGSLGQARGARLDMARQSWPGSARVVWRVPAWKATQRSRGRPVWVRLLPARHGKARQSRRVPLVWSRRGRQRSQGPSRPGLAGLDRSWMVRQSRWSRQVQFGQRTFRQSWLVEVLRGEAS